MLKKSIIVCAAIVLSMTFGICAAFAAVEDELAPCPNCEEECTFEYAEINQYGDPVAYYDYVSDTVCRQRVPLICSNCGHEDEVITDYPHEFPSSYSEGEYINSSQHKITLYQSCGWCHHSFTEETYGKHSYSWEKNGNKMEYICSGCGHVSKTDKLTNTLSVTGKTVTAKYSALKKKAKTFKRTNILKVKNAKGTATYTKASGNKKITINKSTGKITIKKGLKKGTYKLKIKVKAAGNKTYKAATKSATVTVKVK